MAGGDSGRGCDRGGGAGRGGAAAAVAAAPPGQGQKQGHEERGNPAGQGPAAGIPKDRHEAQRGRFTDSKTAA